MRELTLICGPCRQPVEGENEGWIGVSYADLRQAEASEAAGTEAPEVVWHVTHNACAGSGDEYGFEAGEIDTWRSLAAKTSLLLGKPWIHLTDWSDVLEEIADGCDDRFRISDRSPE